MKPVLQRYRVDPDTGCWLWEGYLSSRGYPMIGKAEGIDELWAHRYFYAYYSGEQGNLVHHTCPNKACVNPYHLEDVGSKSEHGAIHGLTHYVAIDREIRALIREEFIPWSRTRGARALAMKYGVSTKTIFNIVNRRLLVDQINQEELA